VAETGKQRIFAPDWLESIMSIEAVRDQVRAITRSNK
jgi:hypothetical protein